MSGAPAFLLSMLMLAGFVLGAGGLYRLFKYRDVKRGVLMLVAAAVMFGNVAVMVVPV